MQLGLGPTNLALQDGFATWNASAADTLAIWDGFLDLISLLSVSVATVPQVSGDGVNAVFFSTTIFGESFGDSTLAVTVLQTTGDLPGVTTEGDVIVNAAFRYDSYRGPLQSDSKGEVYDFHRIALHEFGHVLGLLHREFDPPGQALMEPFISDMDHLSENDVYDLGTTYEASIANVYGEFVARVGNTFYYPEVLASNSPTSFSAVGLPPGVTIDAQTGVTMGTLSTPGKFYPVVTAHGPIADAYASFSVTVHSLNQVPGLLEIIPEDSFSLLADPIRPRIYATDDFGISMINTATSEIVGLVAGSHLPDALSLSTDNSILYFSVQTEGVVHRLDLETLLVLPDLTVPPGYSAFLEGLDGRAYVAGFNEVHRVDAATGEVQETFVAGSLQLVEITPDRKTLLVIDAGISLSSYDISTPVPVLLATVGGAYSRAVASPDSAYLYAFLNVPGEGDKPVRMPLPALSPGVTFGATGFERFSLFGTSVAKDGSIYQSAGGPPGSISVYDPVSLQLREKLSLSYPQPFSSFMPYEIEFDGVGPYFYAAMTSYGQTEVWKFSTDFASYPPPDPQPTKNLVNISTRVRTGSGEDSMIGGFILQGTEPKKVLVRGLGPTVPLTGALSDPVLELYDGAGSLVASNDNWISNLSEIIGSQLPPWSERESALLVTLNPGAYTAVVSDASGQAGQALVEVYDLAPEDAQMANISTRGKVGVGDEVMIGGFIIAGIEPTEVLLRAIGPSLATSGITRPLADPVLELRNSQGELVAINDNWRLSQQAEIVAADLAPTDDREAAIMETLDPGSYTAIVRGQNNTTGVALVEVFNLGQNSAQ